MPTLAQPDSRPSLPWGVFDRIVRGYRLDEVRVIAGRMVYGWGKLAEVDFTLTPTRGDDIAIVGAMLFRSKSGELALQLKNGSPYVPTRIVDDVAREVFDLFGFPRIAAAAAMQSGLVLSFCEGRKVRHS